MEIQKQRFYEHLYERRKDVADNNRGLPMEKYCALIEEVKNAKVAERKSPRMHWLLKHYDVLLVQGMEKLIVPLNNESVDVIYYVHDDELFDILQEVHTSTGHGGRDRMMKKTKEKYKNIVRTEVLLFINLCVSCQTKQKRQKKGIVSKPTIFNDWNSRCQVDLIDYQSHADGKYRYVLVYQDHLTKFVILRPLETKRSEEVAYQLLDVFTMFGAPVVLQSDNGRDFCSKIIEELKKLWPELKMVHGEPRQSQDSLECANQDVENMLTTWMLQNETEHWSQGLRFVQFMKNSALHSGIKRSPYEAMFGRKPKIGLKTSNVPLEAIDDVTTEEHLENIVTFSCIDNSQTGQLESQQSAMDSVKTEKDLEEVVQLIDTDNAHTEHEQSQSLKSELSEDNDYCQKISYAMCSICFNPTNYEALNVENASSENICNCCNRETNKANVRKGALDGLEVQAKRMKVISDSTHPKSEIELTVKIPVPDISRGQGDARSVLAVVLGATADAFTAWVRNKE
ncbi:KRAB-A domain-containing protein 2-like [Sitophilus oryzae]|uniref:KRAB-A domain-containing protein 2-like n=1 Tax=Sitophilus oryzae TaxID=7048 RepID=A0A6J2YPU8_SITOR|nr:KRAB-A domain-containing protein 2-like [Sitophilus oryzae]